MAELVVAFDLPSGREALALADRLSGLRWAKIGPVLFVREGPAVVQEFTRRGVRVFLDLKWHDIPSVVAGAVTAARDLGIAMATVHALGSRAMLAAAARARGSAGTGDADLQLIGVTVLTSHGSEDFEQVMGRGVPDMGAEAERLARLAVSAGLQGVVASGHELGLLRESLGPDPLLVVPGIRFPEPVSAAPGMEDQVRTMGPREAVNLGATHLVVGRPITQAKDPAAAYRRFVEAL